MNIYSNCLNTGYFPNQWKNGLLKLFPKVNKLPEIKYRPICLLPFLGKILEKIIYNRMDRFETKGNIIHNNQFGFRKNSNTEKALLSYTETIYNRTSK